MDQKISATDSFSAWDDSPQYQQARKKMVREQILARGLKEPNLIKAFEEIPRHFFVPAAFRENAYEDYPLPLPGGQTISQPYIVAYMIHALHLRPDLKVLEIGTGSGYHAAVASRLAKEVFTLEIVEELAKTSQQVFQKLNFSNIHSFIKDGHQGLLEYAPYDCIYLTAAPENIPPPLLEQLKEGGKLLAPVGRPRRPQELILLTKKGQEFEKKVLIPVAFVPMVHS